jgi:DHA1 family bicyclomycin/chloramphenicol resistance-like MFS transporter
MNLPALPVIASSLGTSAVAAGGTLSIFLLGFGLAPLLFSPLSDRFGRRPCLLGGLAVFTVAGLVCAAAPSIGWMLAGRLAQGMGAGVSSSMPLAIVRDQFEGAAARARLSYVTLVFSVAPMIAPALGSLVISLSGWRGIYIVLAAASAAILLATSLGLGESLMPSRRRSLDPGLLLARYRGVLTHPVTAGFAAINALSFACMFAFISGSPLVLIANRGFGGAAFSAVLACSASGLIGGSLLNGQLAKRGVSSPRIMIFALTTGTCATLALVGLAAARWDGIAEMLPLLMLSSATYGLVGPNAMHEAMQPMHDAAGIASSVIRLIQILAGALASALVPLLFGVFPTLAMSGVMFGFAVSALLVYVFGIRRIVATPAAVISP